MKINARSHVVGLMLLSFLLLSCQQNTQQTQKAAENLVNGPYYHTRSQSVCLQSRLVFGPGNKQQSAQALIPTTREVWVGSSGAGRIRQGSTGKPIFFSEQDRRQWILQNSPALDDRIDEQMSYGWREMINLLPTLPRNTPALSTTLRAEAQKANRTGADGMAETIRDMLADQLVPEDLRHALYNVAVQLPGTNIQHNITDTMGRKGIAVHVPADLNGSRHDRVLVFDPQTYELLETDEILLASAPWLQVQQPTSFCRTTYQVRETVLSTWETP